MATSTEENSFDLSLQNPERPFRILCLDGGGVRGIIEATILMRLEAETGEKIKDMFDIIVGTSTGGILATGLGVLRMPPSACRKLGEDLAKEIFPPTTVYGKAWRYLWHGSSYDTQRLRKFLKRKCQIDERDAYLKPGKPLIVVVSCDNSKCPPAPFLFRNFVPERSEEFGSFGDLAWEAAVASASAPMYFDPVVRHGMTLVDGGMVANNPTVIGIQEAQGILGRYLDERDLVLSIGTGLWEPETPEELDQDSLSELVFLVEDLAYVACETEETHRRVKGPAYLGLTHGANYIRINPKCKSVPLDTSDQETINYLVNVAEEWISQEPEGRRELNAAVAALTKPPATLTLEHPLLSNLQQLLRTYYMHEFSLMPMPWEPDMKLPLEECKFQLQDEDPKDYKKVLLSFLQKNSIGIIVGEPGAGKTSLCMKICHQWALGNFPRYKLVLFAKLRDLRLVFDSGDYSNVKIIEFVTNWLQQMILFSKEMLQSVQESKEKILVILDGLDECKLEQFTELEAVLMNESHANLPYHLVVTSRPNGSLPKGKLLHIAQMEPWLSELHLQLRAKYDVSEQQQDNAVKIATFNPMHLNLSCLANQDFGNASNLADLYLAICQKMLDKSPLTKLVDVNNWLNDPNIRLLGELATNGLANCQFFFEDQLIGEFREFWLQIGFLTKSSVTISPAWAEAYSAFPHKTFQEFLSAVDLIQDICGPISCKEIEKNALEIEEELRAKLRPDSVLWAVEEFAIQLAKRSSSWGKLADYLEKHKTEE